MLIRLKSSSPVLVVIGSMPMPICNCFHKILANNGKITTFTEVPLFDALVRSFLWTQKIETWTVEIYVQFWKFHVQPVHVYQLISVQIAFEICLAARNCQKIHKNPLFWRSRSSKIIEFGANRKPMYDFLLVINSNLGPILNRYWDTVTYWLKIANFSHTPFI